MILIMQNFGSKPKMSCNTITDVVIIIGFLYSIIFSFTFSNNPNLANNKKFELCAVQTI